ATMLFVIRLWDAFADPLMGVIADRTRSRWGKFRPYLLWGALPYGVCGYLIFANPTLGATGKLVYAYVTYSLMLLAYTAINVPYSSLLGVISPSSRTRTVASSFRFVGAFGGAFLISTLVKPLAAVLGGGSEVRGYQHTMAIFAALSVVMFLVCFAATRERVTPPRGQRTNVAGELRELGRNWPWVTMLLTAIFSTTFIVLRSASTLFYFKYVVADDGQPVLFHFMDRATVFLSSNGACQMLGCVALGFVARRSDKRRLAIVLTAITGLCYASFFVLPAHAFGLQLAVNAVGSLCMGPTSALVWAMYADVADYGEWKFGRRSTALVYSASLFALKTGTMVGGVLLPLFLDWFGFVRDVAQTPRALLGISLAFSLGPGLFAGLKVAALWLYPLTQTKVDEIEQALAERRAAA
ncbi:MAG TPA: glycoside-pentoside-hexuronide (GPH):cation symporter, partial [Opitutaceae bacterium]|nr:glycoside-pentoside-hexuronide (GPH):cation symporter [Opitutaceae bacterium]